MYRHRFRHTSHTHRSHLLLAGWLCLAFLCSCSAHPTATPLPTETAVPTASAQATATPRPSATRIPTATQTPSPTAKPTPTPPTPTATPTPAATPTATAIPRTPVEVVRVIDGDTIRVRLEGQEYSVRYLGIDCPEDGAGAEEARTANQRLLEGQVVTVEMDATDTDEYGRLLRYVWAGERLVNAELVRLGWAVALPQPPDLRYQELLAGLQQEAQAAGRGQWASQLAAGEASPAPTTTGDERPGCDPAYPDVCIPPPPPDLDCGDIPHRRFKVLPPDPHHFDRDEDGVGCES